MSKRLPFLTDTSAATAIEYAMIAAGISIAIVGGVALLGGSVGDLFDLIGGSVGN